MQWMGELCNIATAQSTAASSITSSTMRMETIGNRIIVGFSLRRADDTIDQMQRKRVCCDAMVHLI